MKRSLEHNILFALSGFAVFLIGQLVYTFFKCAKGLDLPFLFFIPLAICLLFSSIAFMFIAHEKPYLCNLFKVFMFLAVINLGDELNGLATKLDFKEFIYAAAVIVYYTVTPSKKK